MLSTSFQNNFGFTHASSFLNIFIIVCQSWLWADLGLPSVRVCVCVCVCERSIQACSIPGFGGEHCALFDLQSLTVCL